MLEEIFKHKRQLDKALSRKVSISHFEVERITVQRLIEIRNSFVNRNKDMSHFDKVLRFFLEEEEFKIHVIEQKPLNE